jgi:hypothetical protein
MANYLVRVEVLGCVEECVSSAGRWPRKILSVN